MTAVSERSIWFNQEVGVAAVSAVLATAVTAVALKKFKEHQAFMALPPFLRKHPAINVLPGKEQQLLQAAYEAKVMAGIYDLQIEAINLAGPESRLWNANEWLAWMRDNPLDGMQELTSRGSHMLDEKRIVNIWAQIGPDEDLVQCAANLQEMAPMESVTWDPQEWFAWLQDGLELDLPEARLGQLAGAIFIRRHRELYRNFLVTARRSIGPHWESLTAGQWLAYIENHRSLHVHLRPLIEKPYGGIYPDSPLRFHQEPDSFFQLLAGDLVARRDPIALGVLENEVAVWNARFDLWSSQLTEEGRTLLDQIMSRRDG